MNSLQWYLVASEIPFDKLILFGNQENGVDLGTRLPSDPNIIYTQAYAWDISDIEFWLEIPEFPHTGFHE